jgi:hypothetical protein
MRPAIYSAMAMTSALVWVGRWPDAVALLQHIIAVLQARSPMDAYRRVDDLQHMQ